LTSPHNFHMRGAVPFLVTFKHVTGADVRAERFVSSAASATSPVEPYAYSSNLRFRID
jgi:hypothetical protein